LILRRNEARAADLAPTIVELQAAGAMSLRAIADGLNQRGIPTARGTGTWLATQVMRVPPARPDAAETRLRFPPPSNRKSAPWR
jgi:hypothetical protein